MFNVQWKRIFKTKLGRTKACPGLHSWFVQSRLTMTAAQRVLKKGERMKKAILVGLVVLMSSCTIIGPGKRGIRISLGQTSNEVKEPGVYFWLPILIGMAEMNVQIQKSEVDASAASKDMQEIRTHVAVNWQITSEKVVETYKNIGDEDDVLKRIITPAVTEAFKAAMSKKTAEEVLAKRTELKNEIDEMLKGRLAVYGVTLNDVSIINLTFSKEFTDAIESKQIAEQNAKKAEYEALQAIQKAKAEVNLAKGQAEAQNLQKQTITPALLQKMAIDKWDGHFPQFLGGNTPLPFVHIGKE